MIPWIFLIVATVGALFTLNAYIPLRRLGPLNIPSFFAGWLTSELSVHHFVWQAVATLTAFRRLRYHRRGGGSSGWLPAPRWQRSSAAERALHKR